MLRANPYVLPMLRSTTAPPIARDRLIGLSGVSPGLVQSMEIDKRIPPQASWSVVQPQLEKIGETVRRLADPDIFTWLETGAEPTQEQIHRSATIVADRLTGAAADPLIRNAQDFDELAHFRSPFSSSSALSRKRRASPESAKFWPMDNSSRYTPRLSPPKRSTAGRLTVPMF